MVQNLVKHTYDKSPKFINGVVKSTAFCLLDVMVKSAIAKSAF